MTEKLLSEICSRAGELSVLPKRELRLQHPDNTTGTESGIDKSYDRARLIGDILFDEFEDDCDDE